ncbi:MAG: hypothetical protein HUU20_01170 [Pirellulales bacterium]|nr:hypothetical protein [Pirellulales bacterium]
MKKWLAGALVRVVVAVLFARLFYPGCLAIFLGAFQESGDATKAVLWVLAPVVTAIGFAVGMMIGNHGQFHPAYPVPPQLIRGR